MHMCPPPSLAGQLLDSVARSLAPGRFEGLLLRGQPLAGGRHVMRPADALRLPMHA